MRAWPLIAVVLLVAVLLFAAALFTPLFKQDVPSARKDPDRLALEPWADGFDAPVALVHDGQGRMHVAEQAGRVLEVAPGGHRLVADLTERVRSGGERGLLGLAFAPEGDLWVHYTDLQGDTVLSWLSLEEDADGAVWRGVEHVVLTQEQPYANHNGGQLLFGPDGMLYLGLGDGGAGGDPHGNGQDPHTVLGAILRIDPQATVEAGTATPPADNPFVHGDGHELVWTYGLRNPWRFAFDGWDLWTGDVGQDHIEEVTVLRGRPPDLGADGGANGEAEGGEAGGRGANLGWNVWEGSSRYRPGPAPGHVGPVAEYDHDGGHCSVTGGVVVRDPAAPGLEGVYVFADHCSGQLWSLDAAKPEDSLRRVLDTDLRVTGFGVDATGGVYVVDHGGQVLRVVAT